jgi:hypothetical protein
MIRVVFGLVCFSALGLAAPCTQQSLATYISFGETGCTAGAFIIKDFAWNNFGTVSVDPADVVITPLISGSAAGIAFSGIDEDTFLVTDNLSIFSWLEYYIDPPPPILDDFSLSMDANSPVFPSSASITAFLCGGGRFVPGCAATGGKNYQLFVEHDGLSLDPPQTVDLDPPVNRLDVRLVIELISRDGQPSQISGGAGVAALIPEPAAAALAAAGLFALAAFRRLRR